MLCVISYFSGDRDRAIDLARWILELGGVSTHDCLLVVDTSTTAAGVVEPLKKAFRSVKVTTSEPAGVQGEWGKGTTDATAANEMWITAGNYVYHMLKCRWFWLETDAIPTRPTWLDEIEAEDKRANKPFLGAYVNSPPHEPHVTGIGVYPPCVADHSMDMAIPGKIAWDYAGRRDTVGKQKAHLTTLIQHEYRVNGAEPTFTNADSLSIIKPRTAVFHRCKDGTLLARLRELLAAKQGAVAIAEQMAKPDPVATENAELRARIDALEKMLSGGLAERFNADTRKTRTETPTESGTLREQSAVRAEGSTPSPSIKRGKPMRRSNRKNKRTAAEQEAINARMAKARAARKQKE